MDGGFDVVDSAKMDEKAQSGDREVEMERSERSERSERREEVRNAMDVDEDENGQGDGAQVAQAPPLPADGMEVERTEQSNSVGPTVVNAFPTTMPADSGAVDDRPQEEVHGDAQFEFGSATEENTNAVHDEHGGGRQEEDGDVEMDGGDGDGDGNEDGSGGGDGGHEQP